MLHANLKAVCSPQTASIGGGAGDTCVHFCAHSGILEELLGVFDNQVLWFECSLSTRCVGLCELQLRFMAQNCPMGHKNVLCFPSDNGWGSLTYVQWPKITKQEECKQQENSIMSQKRSDIAHRVTFSKLLEF